MKRTARMFDDQATPRSPFVVAYSPRSHPDTLTDSIPLLHSSLSIRKPELNARQTVVELLTYNRSVECIRSPVNYLLPLTSWLRRENSIMLVVIPDQYMDKSASGIRVQLMGREVAGVANAAAIHCGLERDRLLATLSFDVMLL